MHKIIISSSSNIINYQILEIILINQIIFLIKIKNSEEDKANHKIILIIIAIILNNYNREILKIEILWTNYTEHNLLKEEVKLIAKHLIIS